MGERTNANGPKAFREETLGEDWLDRLSTDGIPAHTADVLSEPKPAAPQRYRFTFPRQQRGVLCIADFIRSRNWPASGTG
jgi:5-methyltetrahydrofolate--homocysteine methyltransferase